MCVCELLNRLYEYVLYNKDHCSVTAQLLIDDLTKRASWSGERESRVDVERSDISPFVKEMKERAKSGEGIALVIELAQSVKEYSCER